MILRVTLIIITIFFISGMAQAGQNILYYKSEPGDYIGQGQEVLYTSADLDFEGRRGYANDAYVIMNNFTRSNPPDYIWWYADFAAPYGLPLHVGTYENATRFPFQGVTEPGLSFSGEGRGCNTLTGRFNILEITYSTTSDDIINLAVDFEQHCEGREPALFGSIRYNSDVPLPSLLIGKIVLNNPLNSNNCVEANKPEGATIFLSGFSSQDNGSFIYNWSTSTGSIGTGTNFSFDVGVNKSTLVQLTIKDPATGNQSAKTKMVCVSDTTPPLINILRPLDGDVFVGNNIKLDLTITDLVDKNINSYEVFVGKSAILPLNPDTGVSIAKLFKLDFGAYMQSEVTIKAHDASGNVAQKTVNVFIQHDMRR